MKISNRLKTFFWKEISATEIDTQPIPSGYGLAYINHDRLSYIVWRYPLNYVVYAVRRIYAYLVVGYFKPDHIVILLEQEKMKSYEKGYNAALSEHVSSLETSISLMIKILQDKQS